MLVAFGGDGGEDALVEDHVKDGNLRQVLELGVVGLRENARMLAAERSWLLLPLPAVSGILCRSLMADFLHLLLILHRGQSGRWGPTACCRPPPTCPGWC